MARGEYLLEVRSEEIPARMLAAGVRELATRVFEELMARGLPASEIETGFTPRRLLVRMSGLQEREPDREEQVMGPPVRAAYAGDGSPTPALLGFARRCGVEPEQLLRVATEKGEYLAAARRTAGRPTATVLSELVSSCDPHDPSPGLSYRFECLSCRSECPAAAESDPGSEHTCHRRANRQTQLRTHLDGL